MSITGNSEYVILADAHYWTEKTAYFVIVNRRHKFCLVKCEMDQVWNEAVKAHPVVACVEERLFPLRDLQFLNQGKDKLVRVFSSLLQTALGSLQQFVNWDSEIGSYRPVNPVADGAVGYIEIGGQGVIGKPQVVQGGHICFQIQHQNHLRDHV